MSARRAGERAGLIRNATRVAGVSATFCFFVFSSVRSNGVVAVGESPRLGSAVAAVAVRLWVLFAEPIVVAAAPASSSSNLASDRGVSSAGHPVVQGAARWSVSDGAASTAWMSVSALRGLLLLLLLLLRVPPTPEPMLPASAPALLVSALALALLVSMLQLSATTCVALLLLLLLHAASSWVFQRGAVAVS